MSKSWLKSPAKSSANLRSLRYLCLFLKKIPYLFPPQWIVHPAVLAPSLAICPDKFPALRTFVKLLCRRLVEIEGGDELSSHFPEEPDEDLFCDPLFSEKYP